MINKSKNVDNFEDMKNSSVLKVLCRSLNVKRVVGDGTQNIYRHHWLKKQNSSGLCYLFTGSKRD